METLPSTPHFTPRLPDFSTRNANTLIIYRQILHSMILLPVQFKSLSSFYTTIQKPCMGNLLASFQSEVDSDVCKQACTHTILQNVQFTKHHLSQFTSGRYISKHNIKKQNIVPHIHYMLLQSQTLQNVTHSSLSPNIQPILIMSVS